VGNTYISIPHLDPATGVIPDLYVLSDRAAGLVGLRGGSGPLLRVIARDAGGNPVAFVPDEARREEDWIPLLRGLVGRAPATVRIVPPPEERGFLVLVETDADLEVGLEVCWEEVVLAIFRSRPLRLPLSMRWDPWTSSLCGEVLGSPPPVGWAVGAEGLPDHFTLADEGAGWRATLSCRIGRRGRCAFLVTVAPEEDGARTTIVHLRRVGVDALVADSVRWLRQRRVRLRDPALEGRANLNLFFNRFFATGRAVDTERLCAVTSRSPRYYVSGAFWARDALFWSLPGLCVHDPRWATAVLREILQTTWPQGAQHALYLNGTSLYPGFELDQLCAYPIAIQQVALADPRLPREEPLVAEVLRRFPQVLAQHLDSRVGLYRTFLDPSDDPPPHPWLTYDNVLAWRALMVCATGARHASGKAVAAPRLNPLAMARALRPAIRRHCVVSGPFGPMYAWTTDGRGQHTLYDNPSGSLLLLPYHGFCRAADPVWRNTLRWILSKENPFFVDGAFAAPANRHAFHPWPMAACHMILCGQAGRGGEFLRRAEMDGGIACETVDAQTGRVRTGGAFAAFAGYLGAALVQAFGIRPRRPRRRPGSAAER